MSPLAEKVAELAGRGMTATQIAGEIHYTRNAVIGLARRNGIHLQGNDRRARRARARGLVVERQPGVPAPVEAPPARPLPRAGAGSGCRWIEGEVERGVEPGWCGRPVVGSERSWCEAHRARVYYRVGGGSYAQAAE